MKMSKFFARSGHSQRTYPLTMISGETIKLEVDWNELLGERGATIVDTSFETFGNIGVSTATISGGITSAMATADTIGTAIIRNKITLSNDEVLVRDWRLTIKDETHPILFGDYREPLSP